MFPFSLELQLPATIETDKLSSFIYLVHNGVVKADRNVARAPSSSQETTLHDESEVYREPVQTQMVSLFYSHPCIQHLLHTDALKQNTCLLPVEIHITTTFLQERKVALKCIQVDRSLFTCVVLCSSLGVFMVWTADYTLTIIFMPVSIMFIIIVRFYSNSSGITAL